MEEQLLKSILSELKDISSNTGFYDYYDGKLHDVERRLINIEGSLKSQNEMSEAIFDRLSQIRSEMPSHGPDLRALEGTLSDLEKGLHYSNSRLDDIAHNTSG